MSRRVFLSLALAVVCPGAAAWAAPHALGSPFALSACGDCAKGSPEVAGTPSGGFMVVWQGAAASVAPTEASVVPGRLFTPAGNPRGDEFLLDRSGAGPQADGNVAADPQGGYVAVWSTKSEGRSDVFAQRYTVRGRALGAAIAVSADEAGGVPADGILPAVAKSPDGGFTVAWVSLPPDGGAGDAPRVLARRFGATGDPLGPAAQVNAGIAAGDRPDVCIDTAGRAVVAWTTVDGFLPFQASKKGVAARRLAASGAPSGGEITVAAAEYGDSSTAVACGAGNTFVVVWQGGEILAQRYTRLGRRFGPAVRINTQTAGDQAHPRAAYDPTGALVVVWEGRSANGETGVFARRFPADGGDAGPDLTVDFPLRDTLSPAPAVAPVGTDGSFLVVWRDGPVGLWGRRFTP